MSELRTVTIFFDGVSVDITRSADADFDEFLYPALEAFKIPVELKDFFQVLSGHKYLYGREAFNRYVSLYPDCDFVFELRMNFVSMNERVSTKDGKIVIKPILSEKRPLQFDDGSKGDNLLSLNWPMGKRFKANTEEALMTDMS